MDYIQQSFSVRFDYKVFFTTHLFDEGNSTLRDFLHSQKSDTPKKLLFVVDGGVAEHHPKLQQDIKAYFKTDSSFSPIDQLLVIKGGEEAKNEEGLLHLIVSAVNDHGIDRHSYLIAIGGGAILDLAGYAAAISHRGLRHIRIPTTVLSQNDSGIGVKNGINYFNKKNFLGTFSPPIAVFNDSFFLTTLSDEEWRSGMSEAVKVALIKDKNFYSWLQENASLLSARNMEAMQYLIKQCAALHLQHIAGNDPFEMGSSRPLDFGHWSAHKMEQLSQFSIRHGEAVAYGIALDSAYSFISGRLAEDEAESIIKLLKNLGFEITHSLLEIEDDQSPILKGLNEFREHLGGKLTIMLLQEIGKGEEVHELDTDLLRKAGKWLQQYA